MTEDIKQRVDAINRGEVPQGYKKTKVGIVPLDWEVLSICTFVSNTSKKFNPINNKINYKCIELEHINQETGTLNGYVNSSKQLSIKNLFTKTDVLYGKLRPYLKKYYYADFDGVCSSEIWVLKPKQKILRQYLFRVVQSDRFNVICNVSCCGSKMPRADWEYLEQTLFQVPPISEQEKIADILTTCDSVLELKEKLITEKQKQKKWLMQNLLTGKKRLKGFSGEWKNVKLGEIFTERAEFKCNDLELLAITSSRGILKRSDMELKDNSNDDKSKYRKICVGDIGYNTMRMWQGVSAYSNFEGIVSPAYTILKPIENIDAKYYSYLFKIPSIIFIFFRFSQGLVDDTRNLKYSNFKEIKVFAPVDKKEQTAITEILSTADQELELLQQDLNQCKNKKKALMQLLLTGKVRFKL